jgi:uncharacterized protein
VYGTRKRPLVLILALVVISMLALTACPAASPAPATPTPGAAPAVGTPAAPAGTPAAAPASAGQEYRLSFATGGTAGTYYPFGGAIANVVQNAIPGVSINVEATGGSVENVRLITSGEAEIAWAQNDIAHYAYNGEEMFEGSEAPIRAIAATYIEFVQVAAAQDANIMGPEDLRGRNVSVGAPGSGTAVNARQVLDAADMTFQDFGREFQLSFAESATHYRDRQIEAFFVTGGVPNSAILEAALARPVNIMPIDGELRDRIQEEYPFLVAGSVPANTYNGQTTEVQTVGVVAIIIVSEDMDDELAYNLAKAIVEQRALIAQAHDKGSEIQPETITRGITIPLHPGAERYYEEEGLLQQ